MQYRLQKIIAMAGICSRRKAEELIIEGKVSVNGEVAKIGSSADPEKDTISVEGKPILLEEKYYYALHKPKEVLVEKTNNPDDSRPTIYDLDSVKAIPVKVMHVGRLDLMSEGLLLLTNDGDFANRVMHPRYEMEKTYLVRTEPKMKADDIRKIEKGIMVEGELTSPAQIIRQQKNEILITIHEGRNRIIRKIMDLMGYRVFMLKRVLIGKIELADLEVGEVRKLTEQEIKEIMK